MKTYHSFDILVDNETEELAEAFRKAFPKMSGHRMRGGYLYYPNDEYKSTDLVNKFIFSALEEYQSEFEHLAKHYEKTTVRIATYFDAETTAAVFADLSANTISKLHEAKVGLDFCYYPCSDDD